MATLDDAVQIASALEEVTEGLKYGRRTWLVAGKAFAWERPLSKADIKRLNGAPVPEGPLLAVAVEDLDEKEAVLEAGTAGVFTISHFDNYPAVLIQLKRIGKRALREMILDAWLACAPARLTEKYVSSGGR
jgi:hypothetical protein